MTTIAHNMVAVSKLLAACVRVRTSHPHPSVQ